MIKLFTIKHGSWLYGTQTANSDIDLKTIYLPELDDLLAGHPLVIFKQRESGENQPVKPGEQEEEFIPLQSFAAHYLENQSYALELACAYGSGAQIECVNPDYVDLINAFISDLLSLYANKDVNKIIGYAHAQALNYSMKGLRLNQIRLLISAIERAYPDMSKLKVVDLISCLSDANGLNCFTATGTDFSKVFKLDYERRLLICANKNIGFDIPVKGLLRSLKAMERKYGARSNNSTEGTDWKAMAHAVRLFGQGIEFLKTGRIAFPRANKAFLSEIIKGAIDSDYVGDILNEMLIQLIHEQSISRLPARADVEPQFDDFMTRQLRLFYLK